MTVGVKHTVRHGSKTAQKAADFGLILMNQSLEPIGFDPGAAAILNLSNQPGVKRRSCLPKEILREIGKRKLADLAYMRTHFSVGEREYTCGAYLLETCTGSEAQPIVAFRLQRVSSASARRDTPAPKRLAG